MSKSNSPTKGKNIWSLIKIEHLTAAIVSLGDRVNQLKHESWRLNDRTRLSTSLWAQVIEKLKINHNEKNRHSLYNIWTLKRRDIVELVKEELKKININYNDESDGGMDEIDDITASEKSKSNLLSNLSLPLPQRPNTRANQTENVNNDNTEHPVISETSFILSPSEWKAAFSRTREELNDGWRKIFSDKLTSCGITCAVKFRKSYIKKGERKQSCLYLWCRADCTGDYCTRSYLIILKEQVNENTSPIFRVRASGVEKHDAKTVTMRRQLRGEERYRVGKRANEIGPLAVFRERVEAADENLLAAGNHTGCETIEVVKKAGADYRQKHQVDENIYTSCRIIASAYRAADVTSTTVPGYVQVVGEMPFRVHMFSEPQIELYADYCKKEKYSYVHSDATGGVLKQISGQNQTLLYGIVFKDGTDCINTIPLAHALLADHTVPSISYFLGNVAHEISELKKKLIRPSFFVTDFSHALINSILQTFNQESMNTHLNRCWNVLNRNYNTVQLRQLSFIHLCCSHVIHAIARSLNAAHIDKKIRRGVLHIFAFILCGNNLNQLYDILGLVIDIFGDQNEQNAREKFEKMVALELDVDEESVTMLSRPKEILEEAKKKNNELKSVDEYFRSNMPIIHQSPFNIEAIRLYPTLKNLINNKSKYDNTINPLFSPSLIRIFYRWWAYLPLWTGLLWNFEERYSNSLQTNASVIYNPMRHSNALIESYFRTLKGSILQDKINTQPHKIIEEIYRSIKIQLKALKYEVTQSSKGRKRKKNRNGEWSKKGVGKKCRKLHVKAMDVFASIGNRSKMKNAPSNDVMKDSSEEDTASTVPSLDQFSISSDELYDKIDLKEPSESNNNNSRSSSPKYAEVVNSEYSIDVPVDAVKLTPDNNMFSIISTIYSGDNQRTLTTVQPSYHSEALIDGHTMRWPQFGINEAIFKGRSYTFTNTCPTDSALFALYFIYRTDMSVADAFDEAPSTSAYSTLVKIFHIAEKEGWNAARLSWLHTNGILERFAGTKDLFGSVDEQVFRFVKREQHHSWQSECSRVECKRRRRSHPKTELSLFTCDDFIRDFHNESTDRCDIIMAKSDDMSAEVAYQHNYIHAPMVMINEETDTNEHAWICNAITRVSVATFTHDYPPIIITDIRYVPQRNEKRSDDNCPQLVDLKRTITINSIQYRLRAVIHHTYTPIPHFTATLVGLQGHLYLYDDLRNVKEVSTSTGKIVYAIYSKIYTF